MKKLLLILATAGALSAQSFPGSIYTPLVAKDNLQTTLTVAMAAGDTTAFVASTTRWAANTTAYICDTTTISGGIARCTGTFEVMLVTAVAGANALTVTRGYGGTSAIAHANGKAVINAPTAVYNTTLSDEVLAIETALGANLANVLSTGPYISSATYNFSPQTPGGSLIIGNTSVAMVPVPAGVNGTDLNHYLYVSGGTGTAEACLITGGTGTAGTNGAIIINCANTHSGAWTIASATQGISEALQGLVTIGVGGRVILPSGTVTVRAPIRVNGTGYYIQGQGMQATAVVTTTTDSSNIFEFIAASLGSFNGLSDLGIFGPGGTVPTAKSGGAAVKLTNQSYFTGTNVYIYAVPHGINSTTSGFLLSNINAREVKPTTGIGIYVDGGGTFDQVINHFTLDAAAAYKAGIELVDTGYVAIDRADIVHANYDLLIDPGNGQFVNTVDVLGSYFDTSYIAGIYIAPTGTGIVTRVRFVDCWTASSTITGVFISGTGSTVVDGISFIGHYSPFNTQQGFSIGGATTKNIEIRDSFVFGNSSVSSGTYDGIAIAADVIGVKVTNTVSGRYGDATNTQLRGLSIGAGASDHIQVQGNDFRENVTGPLLDNSTGTHKIIRDNLGIDDVAPSTVASAATFTLPLDDSPIVYVSGTTAIDTIAGGWIGRQISLRFTNAAPAGVSASGNVYNAVAASQNQTLSCTFDGTKWLCTGGTQTGVYSVAGVLQAAGRVVFGTCTLGTDCAVTFGLAWTSSSSYRCAATDRTAAAAVKVVNTSASVATFTGTGTDLLSFICAGN